MSRKQKKALTAQPSRGAVPRSALVAISLMLFSMFFGAGNLIFPPIVGVNSGSHFIAAISGFLIGAVILPVLSIIAIAVSGRDVRDLARRAGGVFNVCFAVAIYLSIGALYGIPRTGAVSFSMAITPIFGWSSTWASVLFSACFFSVALWLAISPTDLVDRLGKILTPLLLILLVVLVISSAFTLTGGNREPSSDYASNPLFSGLMDGYTTMDSLAALAFGILVMSGLRHAALKRTSMTDDEIDELKGQSGLISADDVTTPRNMVRMATTAALIAGSLLAIIYVGLAFIGHSIPGGKKYSDGALLLADAAYQVLGKPGQIVLGLIVLLACMTTAVGLLAATSEFFHNLIPRVSYTVWIIGFAVFSFAVSSMGLSAVLAIAAPIITFLYPIAITVVVLTIVGSLVGSKAPMKASFRAGAWCAAVISFFMVAAPSVVAWIPLASIGLAWVLPVVIATGAGVVWDQSHKS